MWEHCIGYRFQNGDVEGLIGFSLVDKETAMARALKRLNEKLSILGETLDPAKLAENDNDAKRIFNANERKLIVSHWELCRLFSN